MKNIFKQILKWLSITMAGILVIVFVYLTAKQSLKMAAIEGACIAVDCMNRHIADPKKVSAWDCIMKNFAKQGWELVNAQVVEKTK